MFLEYHQLQMTLLKFSHLEKLKLLGLQRILVDYRQLILKQLLFFDRYAKAAAPSLNVFNDFYLIDFLFTPKAMQSGLDFNVLMPLMQRIQARAQAEGKKLAP